MFLTFLDTLRSNGLKVGLTEWNHLLKALALGHARSSLSSFYAVSRSLLVHREADFDSFDAAFASHFRGVESVFDIDEELRSWLENPILPNISKERLAALEALDLDKLREMFEERLAEQKERHDGGSKWVGTGGTSPFGHGGAHPSGVRIGGPGGGRSAVQVAEDRRFRSLRTDRIVGQRNMNVALRRLRKLGRSDGQLELDIEETVRSTSKNGGEIELEFRPPRKSRIRLMLLMDIGGSMDPYAELSEQIFSAAHQADHFADFRAYTFHNCVYETLFTDMHRGIGEKSERVLTAVDDTWNVIIVGDAWMSPFELTHVGGAIDYRHQNHTPGIEWLKKIKQRCPKSVWLNPESTDVWRAESVRMVRQVFDMYPFSIDGLTDAIDTLRGIRH